MRQHAQVADLLLAWACTAERLLRDKDAGAQQAELDAEAASYLLQPLTFEQDKVLDSNGEAVMMAWEKPLMLAHANLLCQNGGHVLNVGFGMGLVDEAIQQCVPARITAQHERVRVQTGQQCVRCL